MTLKSLMSHPHAGALWAMLAICLFSSNDVAVKLISGDYALHEIMMIRSLIGLLVVAAFIMPFAGGWRAIKSTRIPLHIARSLCVVMANMSFFMGLAVLPIADAVAIFFVAPMLITGLSVLFLGEVVGLRRWGAIVVGFIGVGVVLQPGSDSFQLASLLPVLAAFFYACVHILARKLGPTESAATMAFYIQLTFLAVCIVVGLAIGDGRFGDQENASLAFLFRAWSWPIWEDVPLLIVIGVATALGGTMISQAYRISEAAVVAPFEYIAIPLSIFWGVVVFGEWPNRLAWAGIALILVSGLYLLWRETRSNVTVTADAPTRPQ